MRHLLEHESKRLAAEQGIAVPRGVLMSTGEELPNAPPSFGEKVVLKAQVPTGGRGRAGGVEVVDRELAGAAAKGLLERSIRGYPVRAVLLEELIEATAELYMALTVDTRLRAPVLLLGERGGVDVEDEAQHVIRVPIAMSRGPDREACMQAFARLDAPSTLHDRLWDVANRLFTLFATHRAYTVELNPLVVTRDGELVAVDARVVANVGEESAGEINLGAHLGFDLVMLNAEGDVGLLTTGAGASMMLVDMLTEVGLAPVNFCDVRTGGMRGDPTRFEFIFEALRDGPRLRCIAVNIFAGITDLLEVSELLSRALASTPPGVPLVARLEGRNRDRARERLERLGVVAVDDLDRLVEACARICRPEYRRPRPPSGSS